ncbi:MAG: SHOCT domain-containing protein [Alphaproteobacteria bacterium]|nr:SHOCT domain-containing protein [Alphaproteobacteria bacterium]
MFGSGPYGMMAYGWQAMGGMMAIFWAVVLAAALMAIILVMRAMANGSHVAPQPHRRAGGLDRLDERLARGEIDREEYQRRKHALLAHRRRG